MSTPSISSRQAITFSIAIVISALILAYAIIHRNDPVRSISVTGLGSQDFESDLVVWEGRFTSQKIDLKSAYTELKAHKILVEGYLESQNIADTELVFSAVQTFKQTQSKYSNDGRYNGEEFVGYELSQTVTIRSKEVDKVENVSRSITDLLNQGVQLFSNPPRYYYTKLAELKLDMIAKATADARSRAEQIAIQSGGKLGKVMDAKMGIFQITGRLSNEDYSWSGAFNTMDKDKSASITMRLKYTVK
jgi:hypothetical protein